MNWQNDEMAKWKNIKFFYFYLYFIFIGKKVVELYSTSYFLKECENLSADKLRNMVEEYVDEDKSKLGIIGIKMGLNKLMYWTPVSTISFNQFNYLRFDNNI